MTRGAKHHLAPGGPSRQNARRRRNWTAAGMSERGWRMASRRFSTAAVLIAVALLCAQVSAAETPPEAAQPASPPAAAAPEQASPPLKCRIGKPSYCAKYGGFRCRKKNDLPNAEAECAAWTQACFECHYQIPECFGHKRPLADSPKCAACEQQWHECMGRIDARHWPNRRKGSD